jgi:hypothetical protein
MIAQRDHKTQQNVMLVDETATVNYSMIEQTQNFKESLAFFSNR